MKRAIVVAILAALALILVALLVDFGPSSGPRRPAPAAQRDAPGKTTGGYKPGTDSPPAETPPADE